MARPFPPRRGTAQKLAFPACATESNDYHAQPYGSYCRDERRRGSRHGGLCHVNAQDLIARFSQGISPQLAGRINESAPFWVSLLLVLLIAWYIARLVWAAWPAAEPQWIPPPVVLASGQPASQAFDPGRIVAAHLFGVASADPEPPPVADDDVIDAPDTRLNLRLRGAVMADESRLAHAIIADASGTEKVYFINDNIPGGARLQRVQLDRVVLNRSGTLEVLRLPRELSSAPPPPPPAAPAPVARSGVRPPTARPRTEPAPATVQEAVSQGAAGFLEIVRPAPFMPDGQLRGYRLFPGPNRQRFNALGLRSGDLVTEINGMALDNPAQGMEIFNSLGETTQVTLTLERDGQPETLNLDLSQIDLAGGAIQ